MKRCFTFLTILLAIGFTSLPASGQEETKKEAKTISLEDAKTVSDVDKWYSGELTKLYTSGAVRLRLAAGEKILEIAKTNAEKKKGYQYKLAALTALVSVGEEGAQEKLDKLTKELETNEEFRSLIYDSQFQRFVNNADLKNIGDFDKFKQELKTWLNKPHLTHKTAVRLSLSKVKTYARTVVKDDEEFFTKFLHELIEHINSSENTLAENLKKEISDTLEASIRTQVGNDPKLYGKTIDDKDFDWQSLRGKYVIVKFTATWCGPCKAEIPGLISAYEKYKDKGLEIISVYIWERGDDVDKIVENVKKFAEDEKIKWLLVSEALTEKAGQPKQGDFYSIQGVPTILLIDKEGKIIDANARGEHLQEKLAEIFK